VYSNENTRDSQWAHYSEPVPRYAHQFVYNHVTKVSRGIDIVFSEYYVKCLLVIFVCCLVCYLNFAGFAAWLQ